MQLIAHRKCRQRHSCLKSAFWKGDRVSPERNVAWHFVLVGSLYNGRAASIAALGELQDGKTYRTSPKSATWGIYSHTKSWELCNVC